MTCVKEISKEHFDLLNKTDDVMVLKYHNKYYKVVQIMSNELTYNDDLDCCRGWHSKDNLMRG